MLVAEIEGDWFIILRGLKDLRQVRCNGGSDCRGHLWPVKR